ncbi:MAG: GntR family transcriptional regulator [Brevinema sp.]
MYKRNYLYLQVAKAIYNDFITGQLSSGDTIPTEMTLVTHYGVSRSTIRQSIQELVKNQILTAVQGSGTYVTKNHKATQYYILENFGEFAQRVGGTPKTKVLHFEVIKADLFIAQQLEIAVSSDVFYTKRIRYLNDKIVEYEVGYMPVALFPDLSYSVMASSKYNYIEQVKGWEIQGGNLTVIPIVVDQELSDLLDISIDTPIVCVKSISFLSNNTVFEYTESYRIPEHHPFQLTINRRIN